MAAVAYSSISNKFLCHLPPLSLENSFIARALARQIPHQPLTVPQVRQLLTQYSGWGQREMGLMGRVPHSRRNQVLPHTFFFGRNYRRRLLPALSCAVHGDRGLFFLPSSIYPASNFFFFFSSNGVLGLLLDFQISTKCLLSIDDCQN